MIRHNPHFPCQVNARKLRLAERPFVSVTTSSVPRAPTILRTKRATRVESHSHLKVDPMNLKNTLSLCLILNGAIGQPFTTPYEHVDKHLPEKTGNRLVWSEWLPSVIAPAYETLAVESKEALTKAKRNPIEKPFQGNIEDMTAWWQAAYDEDNLYVWVRVKKRGAEFHQPKGGDEYKKDLIELFIDPSGKGEQKYQLCANPLGLRYDGHQDNAKWNADWTTTGIHEKERWGVNYTIPLACFGNNFSPQTRVIGINVGVVIDGQLVSWNGKWGTPKTYGQLWLGRIEKPPVTRVGMSLLMDRKIYDALDLTAQGHLKASEILPKDAGIRMTLSNDEGYLYETQIKTPQHGSLLAFLLDIRGLNPGRYNLVTDVVREEKVIGTSKSAFQIVPLVHGAKKPPPSGKIPILVQPNAVAHGERLLTCGVPLPRGVAMTANHVRLMNDDGKTEMPLQAKVTARWSPRGYVKWMLLDFPGRVRKEEITTYQLEYGPEVKRAQPQTTLSMTREAGLIHVSTGPLQFSLRESGFSFLESATLNGKELISGSRITLADEFGNLYEAAADKDSTVTIEESGPFRAVIAAKGWFANRGRKVGQYVVRIYAYAGQAHLRVFHTFIITESTKKIRYRNISLESRLTRAGDKAFGTDNGRVFTESSRAWLVQESHDRFRVATSRFKGEKVIAAGRRSSGWAGAGGVTVAVRDMWQQFPKELEIDGRNLRVHFWPKHPGPIRHPREKVTARDIHMLWFAHEGELLDFSMPADYASFPKGRDEFHYITNVLKNHSDEALGIAKTHEMVWHFHKPGADLSEDVAALNEDIACLPAPKWIADTGVLGRIHPVDTERFPEIETALSAHFDYLQRMTEYLHDYGMWNFGDRHSRWNVWERRAPVNRTWANHHHGNPRTYWLQYLRSGQSKYLTAARRHAMHLMDVDICHYSTPEYEAKGYPNHKIPGALCDYKGLVHWHSGGRLYDYNNLNDYLFYNYYLTGYRRAVDVAQETADSVARIEPNLNPGRDGAGPLSSLTFLYESTWDPRLLPRIQGYGRVMLGSQHKDEPYIGYFEGWASYAPWLIRYLSLTRDPEAVKVMERLCDFLAVSGFFGSGGDPYWDVLSEGYRRFGKPEYLARGLAEMNLVLGDQFLERGHFYDGHFTASLTLHGGYFTQVIPYFLGELAAAKEPIVPDYGISWWAAGKIWMWITPQKFEPAKSMLKKHNGLPIVVVHEDRDRDFTITLNGAFGKDASARIVHASGAEAVRTKLGEKGGELKVPSDGKTGDYTIWVTTRSDRPYVVMPVSDLKKEVFHWRLLTSRRMKAFYFQTQPDAKDAIIDVAFGYDAQGASVRRADGSVIKSIYDGRAHKARWGRMSFPVTSDLKGQILHFTHGRLHDEVSFNPVRGLIPWLSLTPERFFVPSQKIPSK